MKKYKGKIIKEVKFYPDEWNRVIALSKKHKKLPAAYIREQAVDGEIMKPNLDDSIDELLGDENKALFDINRIAKTVNTEKSVYLKDVIEIEKTILFLDDLMNNKLKPFVFKEVISLWQ